MINFTNAADNHPKLKNVDSTTNESIHVKPQIYGQSINSAAMFFLQLGIEDVKLDESMPFKVLDYIFKKSQRKKYVEHAAAYLKNKQLL